MFRAQSVPRLVALFVAVTIIASACGGGDSGDSASGTDDSATTEETESSTADEPGFDEEADGSDTVSAEDEAVAIAEGGTLRIGLQNEAGSLNPTNTPLNRGPVMIASAIFESLTVVDGDGQWHNNLTESWTPNEDFSSWDVVVRPGIEFSDGAPLDAAAVVGSIEATIRHPLVGLVFRPAFDAETPVELIDDMTFRLNGNGPNAAMPVYFAEQLGMIGSPNWLAAAGENPELDQTPIGVGPFIITERSQDASTVLVRNENWWRGADQIALDSIEFFPNDQPGNRAEQLLAGDVDLIHGTAGLMIRPLRDAGDSIQRIEDNSGEEFFFLMNAQVPPFNDIRVRQAATHLFPKEDYATFIDQGTSLLADSLFSAENPFHDPNIVQQSDQPELATPLIEAYCSEVPDSCTDGRVDIEYQYDVSLSNDLIFDLLSDSMADHFNITVQTIPNDLHIQEVTLGQYQWASWRYHGFSDPDIDTAFLTCSTIGALSVNFARNCNEERDALFEAQRSTQSFEERYEIWQEIQANIRDSYQYVLATHSNWTVGANPNVGGLCDATAPEGAALPCQTRGVPSLHQLFLTN